MTTQDLHEMDGPMVTLPHTETIATSAAPFSTGLQSINSFCEENDVSPSYTYELLADPTSKLKAVKSGKKTLITRESAAAWRASLPPFTSGSPNAISAKRSSQRRKLGLVKPVPPSQPAVATSRSRTRALVERTPQQHRTSPDDGGGVLDPQNHLPMRPRGNADVVVGHFLAERDRLWPGTTTHAAAIEKLRSEAARFLKAGATVSQLIETLSSQMEAVAKKDRGVPLTMRTIIGGTASVAGKKVQVSTLS